MNGLENHPQSSVTNESQSEKASFTIGVIALCFGALAAVWSFLGGACCGWASWGWAFIGLVLSVVSLIMKRSQIGWWALGLSLFAIIWVFLSAAVFTSGVEKSTKEIERSLRR